MCYRVWECEQADTAAPLTCSRVGREDKQADGFSCAVRLCALTLRFPFERASKPTSRFSDVRVLFVGESDRFQISRACC